MQRSSLVLFGTALCLLATGVLSFTLKSVSEKRAHLNALAEEEWASLAEAKEFLEMGLIDNALSIAANFEEAITSQSSTADDWLDLMLKAFTLKKDKKSLASLFEWSKEAFLQNEEALLLAAEYYLENNLTIEYSSLRNFWRGFEEKESAWLFLDADCLALKGQKEEAYQLLTSQSFSGKEDALRNLRLSMLFADQDPKKAWGFLVEASKKEPKNPLIISSKAHLLEKMGNVEAAKEEFELSLKLSQNSFDEEKEYVSFLLRQKEFSKAIPKIFSQLNDYSPKEDWYQAIFLNKVTTPLETPPKLSPIANDPYANYLLSLKSDELWNKRKFLELDQADEILKKEPTAFWLRLLSAFKQENLKEAWIALHTAPPLKENELSLATSLKHLLAFRGLGVADVEEISTLLTTKEFTQASGFKTLLKHLARSSLPGEPPIETTEELDTFLESQEVVSALLLNEGWYEAAILLYPFEKTTQEAPQWVIEKMVKAIETNRNVAKALEFAAYHHPKYDLFKATKELLLTAQDSERDLDKLKLLLQQNSEAGLLSAKLLVDYHLSENNYPAAKNVIEQQPKLHFTPLGKEMLARIAIKEGDALRAGDIYETIVKESVEAKSFLAKRAFKERDWKMAHQLTIELLREYPNNPTLLQNLQAINTHR